MITSSYRYSDGTLACEGIDLRELAKKAGTPLYVYSATDIRHNALRIKDGLSEDHFRFRYAVKANSNPELIKLIAGCGFGMDVVSGGELRICLQAGVDPGAIAFAGAGKDDWEMNEALRSNVGHVSLESEWEIAQFRRLLAEVPDSRTRFLVRCNPNVGGGTHPFMITGTDDTKFGILTELVEQHYRRWQQEFGGRIEGLHFHIGSGITDVNFFADAAQMARATVSAVRARGGKVALLNFGGGVGVRYASNDPVDWDAYKQTVRNLQSQLDVDIILEPGKSVVAEAGVLIARVLQFKKGRSKDFVILDAAMNDLLRPALYDAYHEVWPLYEGAREVNDKPVDFVGPVCESGDFLAKNRRSPALQPGDYVAILTAGAYGYSMSSNYNERPSPIEVLVDGEDYRVIRQRGCHCPADSGTPR